jgi:hypothetical protein
MRAAVSRNPDLVTLARGYGPRQSRPAQAFGLVTGGVPLGAAGTAIGAAGTCAVDLAKSRDASNSHVRVLRQADPKRRSNPW